MTASRLLVASNRLPVTVRVTDGQLRLTHATGGLATGLRRWHEESGSVWVGWPGDVSHLTSDQRASLDGMLSQRHIVPVHLTPDQIDRYYDRFANGVLWPVFHYLVDRVPPDATGWEAYRQVNERFADAIAAAHVPGDLIWIHDYQLLLTPALVRQRVPHAKIGFFLHIPFPSSEVFRVLPWRREILQGLLGADLIGFHTFAYLRHFLASLRHVLGLEADVDSIRVGSRRVHTGVFPMGIDVAGFERLARQPEVRSHAETIRREAGGRRIVLGVDRLDYTKGIPRRLQALEHLFDADPALRDRIRYIQIAVPSRERVGSYREFRRQIEQAVGRLNGLTATVRSTPIHYMHRAISRRDLVALYAAADVMLVTPLRDGMNLVAKEFIASRVDEDGVLVLSEFAGAAAELGDAVVVNPYDVQGIAGAIRTSLAMPEAERRGRMRQLRSRVQAYDVHRWVEQFTSHLAATRVAVSTADVAAEDRTLDEEIGALKQAPRLALLLDYDGTLVPIAPSPELAAPDEDLVRLLGDLARRPGTELHIVSGRPRETLDTWFGRVPMRLWAEHGFWRRTADGEWTATAELPFDWLRHVRPILDQFTRATPGSFVEEKTAAIAWHYRLSDAEFGRRQAYELRMLLGDALSNQPLEVLEGKKVVEIRLRGVNKARAAAAVTERDGPLPAILAVGDDRTDQDLFAALPRSAVTVAVGELPGRARFHVPSHHEVRALLHSLLVP